jgi:hypothetical protein
MNIKLFIIIGFIMWLVWRSGAVLAYYAIAGSIPEIQNSMFTIFCSFP